MRTAVLVVCLAVHLLPALIIAFTGRFPSPYDELAHVSLALDMAEQPAAVPAYGQMQLRNPGDLAQRTNASNYLNHPAPFYLAMGALARAAAPAGDPAMVLALRLACVALSTVGIALMLVAVLRAPLSTPARVTGCALAVAFPKYALVAGMANNDSAALLGAGLMVFALLRPQPSARIAAAALIVAGMVKLTALVAAVPVVAFLLATGTWRDRRDRLVLGGATALAALPYAWNLIAFGAPAPVDLATYQVDPADRPGWDAAMWGRHFLTMLALKWPAVERLQPGLPILVQLGGLGLLMVMAVWGTRGATRHDATARAAAAFGVAAATVFLTHLAFGWQAFRSMGDVTIAQTRYYGPVWPFVALGCASALDRMRSGQTATATVLVAAAFASTLPMEMLRRLAGA